MAVNRLTTDTWPALVKTPVIFPTTPKLILTKDDTLQKQVQLNNKLSQAVNVYGRNREKFSQIDRNRYNLHKKPSSRNRKFLEEDKPSKIKLTRNVKKDLNG